MPTPVEALALILDRVAPLPPRRTPLAEALGLAAAEPLVSGEQVPSFTNSLSTVSAAYVVSPPAHGTAVVNGSLVTYTPALNWNGIDSFTYKTSDGSLDSNAATVTITVTSVNDAPVAVADSATTAEDTAKDIAVLANDSDVEGSPLTAAVVSAPAHGTATVNGDGTVHYVPAANYNGADSFTYKTSDGSLDSNTATVLSVAKSSSSSGACIRWSRKSWRGCITATSCIASRAAVGCCSVACATRCARCRRATKRSAGPSGSVSSRQKSGAG